MDENARAGGLGLRAHSAAEFYRMVRVAIVTLGLSWVTTNFIDTLPLLIGSSASSSQSKQTATLICEDAHVEAAVRHGVQEAFVTLANQRLLELVIPPMQHSDCEAHKVPAEKPAANEQSSPPASDGRTADGTSATAKAPGP